MFIDTSYKMICKTGAHTVNDLNRTGLKKVMVLLSSLKGMDDESKSMIFGAGGAAAGKRKEQLQKGLPVVDDSF